MGPVQVRTVERIMDVPVHQIQQDTVDVPIAQIQEQLVEVIDVPVVLDRKGDR